MKLPKSYQPNLYESDIYALWEKSGAFRPTGEGEPFTVIMPPPNANASLHAGHSLTYALQDIVVRYQRLKGRSVLWVPGADHAGFETQVVYEKHLQKSGKSRFDFTREELYNQIWDFVQTNKGGFEQQLRQLGASCDWDHFTFTLDKKVVRTAYDAFKRMWDDGLIYRGERLVNFCTYHGTAFADIEVEHREVQGNLWHISYPLTDGSGSITIATTRPETLLGDTAVAVHPDDKRYKSLIGKTISLPLTQREIPIIADTFVSKDFGSGAVKITPAHDQNDYEAAQRHDLPFITVIDHEGRMNYAAGEVYRGMTVNEARAQVVKDLQKDGLVSAIEDYSHSVGHCYKCGTVIEPLLRDQWFINMKPLAKEAIEALKANKITFHPKGKKEEVIRYLQDVHDWNISRQIAWGIPIPAFQNVDNTDDWIFNDKVDQETMNVEGKTYRRDSDVFDTWFSSGQWPYATLDFPDGEDFKKYYPTDLMETGSDILFQWVSRMICLGVYITGDIPFKTVYLHGMVRSEDGRKMSKSLGNVIPLTETVNTYGSDALRMGVIAGRSAGYSASYAPAKIISGRNFCNKLWNVARFIEDKISGEFTFGEHPHPETIADTWILHKLQQSIREIGKLLDSYRFSEAYEEVYQLLWNDFADWYIEASKSKVNKSVLSYGLETILKLSHPFAPFVTETIWQTLTRGSSSSLLISASWPEQHKTTYSYEEFKEVKAIVEEIRNAAASLKLKKRNLSFKDDAILIDKQTELIKNLAKLHSVNKTNNDNGLRITAATDECWLEVDNKTLKEFSDQQQIKLTEQGRVVEQLQKRLANKSYVSNAPKAIVDQTNQQLNDAKSLLEKLNAEQSKYSKLL